MVVEKWEDIPGYSYYAVSNLGNVKSFRFDKIKIMKPQMSADGYYVVAIRRNKIAKTFKVHQLVAMAFLNHKPNGYKVIIDHINNNPLDNRVENLQLTTQRNNLSKDKKGGASQYVGVFLNKKNNKWRSAIRIEGKKHYLGTFKTELEASNAYQEKLKEIK